jgi:subtilisin-like proprotein convertase family protein
MRTMKTMKTILGAATAALMLAGMAARAGITYAGFPATIPDGNPVGISSTATASGLGSVINSVTLTLDVSGGNNGDLYAYLSYGGQLVTLLNRPGVSGGNPVGYTDAGLNVTLADGNPDINTYGSSSYTTSGGQVTGTYSAAGGSVAFGSAYDGLNPNGTWTLFIADMSGGDPNNSQLVSWNLNITAVPEPVGMALAMFAGLAGLWWCLGVCWKKADTQGGELEDSESNRG